MAPTQSVQCFGKKKTATAVAQCKVRTNPEKNTHPSLSDGWRNARRHGGGRQSQMKEKISSSRGEGNE